MVLQDRNNDWNKVGRITADGRMEVTDLSGTLGLVGGIATAGSKVGVWDHTRFLTFDQNMHLLGTDDSPLTNDAPLIDQNNFMQNAQTMDVCERSFYVPGMNFNGFDGKKPGSSLQPKFSVARYELS